MSSTRKRKRPKIVQRTSGPKGPSPSTATQVPTVVATPQIPADSNYATVTATATIQKSSQSSINSNAKKRTTRSRPSEASKRGSSDSSSRSSDNTNSPGKYRYARDTAPMGPEDNPYPNIYTHSLLQIRDFMKNGRSGKPMPDKVTRRSRKIKKNKQTDPDSTAAAQVTPEPSSTEENGPNVKFIDGKFVVVENEVVVGEPERQLDTNSQVCFRQSAWSMFMELC